MSGEKSERSEKKTGFWQRAALRATIVLAGLGAGQKAAAQDQPELPKGENTETLARTLPESTLTREDVADFRRAAAETKAELRENVVDAAEEIVSAARDGHFGVKPSRSGYSSREEYKEALQEWKEERRKPSAKDFDSTKEYHDALQDWKEAREDDIGEKMSLLAAIRLQEMQIKTGKMAIGVHEMMADAAENAVEFSERTAGLDPESEEYKKALKDLKKETKKEDSVKKMKRLARSAAKGTPGISETLQKIGLYARNEKALDAEIAKGVKANEKIVRAAEKQEINAAVAMAKLRGGSGR